MGVRLLGTIAGAVTLALTLAGCSNSDSPPPPATTAPLPTLENPPTRQATVPATSASPAASRTPVASPSPSPTVQATPEPTATQSASGSTSDVIDAAVDTVGAVYRPQLTRDTCIADNPDSKPCVSLSSDEGSVQSGIARFTGGYPDGGGFSFYMGRDLSGDWGYWFGTQQQYYQLVEFPGDLRLCGGGSDVTIRQDPVGSSGPSGTMADGSTIPAEEFVLTVAGSPNSGNRGEGWYRVGGATPGWVPATQSTDASLGSCDLHDAIEGSAPRG